MYSIKVYDAMVVLYSIKVCKYDAIRKYAKKSIVVLLSAMLRR